MDRILNYNSNKSTRSTREKLEITPPRRSWQPVDLDSLGPACMVADVDAKKVEPSCADTHERGGAPLLAGAAPAPTESTISIEPAGKAEKAVAAKPEASVLWAQDRAGREVETPLREGEGGPDALPPQGECMVKGTPPQGEASREVETPLRKVQKRTEALPPEGERECGATPQGVAKPKVERLPRGGKHKASKPPPEALPQRGERNPEALSRKRKLECPEARTRGTAARRQARTWHDTARQSEQGQM